jgi:hypothetical protein
MHEQRTWFEWGAPWVIAAVGAAVSAWYGATSWGVLFPDEIFQTLEPAHKLVYGYGFETWESSYGGRNFTLNLLMAVPYTLMRLFGVEDPSLQVASMRGLFAGVTAVAAVGAWRLARVGGAGRYWAAAACALVAWSPLQFVLGFRTLTEVPAAALLVWGVALVYRGSSAEGAGADDDRPGIDMLPHRGSFVAGMCCLGLAVLVRLQMGIAVAGLVLTWRVRGQLTRYRAAMRILVVWALVYGLVDWFIFGMPFQSAGGYLRFHLILGGTTTYEQMNGPAFYGLVMLTTLGPGVALLVLSPLSWRRWRAPIIAAMLFVVLHLLHAHRQVRFIWPVIPLLAGLGAVGAGVAQRELSSVGRRIARVAAVSLFIGVGAWGLYRTPDLTMRDIGQAEILGIENNESVWRWRHELNAMLLDAHERTDLCGLRLVGESAVNSGGYAFLHRDVPFYHAIDYMPVDGEPEDAATRTPDASHYNYLIARHSVDVPHPFEPVTRRGQWRLYRRSEGGCEVDGDFEARVFRPANMER